VDREQAARALGVDPDRPTALVTLGAGTINDLSSDLGLVVGRLAEEPGLQVVLTRPVIATEAGPVAERVRAVSLYPISRYLSAVDLAFAAAGYNSFHELVGAGVPTAFVPNLSTQLDDQLGRARWAEESGAGLCLAGVDAAGVDAAVRWLTDPQQRGRMADRCRALRRPNGAGPAMAAVEQLLGVPGRANRPAG
jgi:UDP:flavonoid glycosyltransferase YjiC (YdhE family)